MNSSQNDEVPSAGLVLTTINSCQDDVDASTDTFTSSSGTTRSLGLDSSEVLGLGSKHPKCLHRSEQNEKVSVDISASSRVVK